MTEIWNIKLAEKLKNTFDEIWKEATPFGLSQHTKSAK